MGRTDIKLPFGLDEAGTLVHINDVTSGKACGCICPSCRSPLVAAKGNKNRHHFKHAIINDCEGGLESAIHLAAKKIIMERREITLPECVSIVSQEDSRGVSRTERQVVVREGTTILFDRVQEEVEIHGMKADIFATKNDIPLIIEIFYRHEVDSHKCEKIVRADISAIEIDLSDLSPDDVNDWEAFWLCINDPQRVQWLYNSKASRDIYRKLERRLEDKISDIEKRYELEDLEWQKRTEREKAQLKQAVSDLETFCNKDYVEKLREEAKAHPEWEYHSKFLPFSWSELPDFLDVDVPNGEWIFGCDRRIWQTAFYGYFVRYKAKSFTVRAVDNWIQNTLKFKVPRCAKTVGIYGRHYPELLPENVLNNLPSSWVTLVAYFNHLERLGMLEFSGTERGYPGSYWFRVVQDQSQKESLGAFLQ